MLTNISRLLLIAALSLLADSSHAALPPESAWKQFWWDETSGAWSPLGVIVLNADADRVTAQPIAATCTTRGVSLPEAAMTGSIRSNEVSFRGNFGKRLDAKGNPTAEDLWIDFRLRFSDDKTLEGATFDGDKPLGRTRLVRLSDAELLGELEQSVRVWQVERKVVEASLEPLREQLRFLEKQQADDRALGRVGLDSQSTLVLDDTKNRLMVEDLRLAGANEGERAARELATRLAAQLRVPAADRRLPAIGPGESFWVQHWKNPQDGQWTQLGIVHMLEQPDGLTVRPISFTYTARGAQLPDGPLRGRKGDAGLMLRGTFGQRVDPGTGRPSDQRLELDFDLKATTPDEFAGVIRDGTRTLGETRFVRVADKNQLIELLGKIELQWGIERAVAMGTIPSLRDQVSTLEKQDQNERANGGGGLTPMARINLDQARNSILVEELRLMVTTGGIIGVREMAIRLREAP